MIKNVIFDLGNVVLDLGNVFTYKFLMEKYDLDEETAKYLYNEIFKSPEWRMADGGEITDDEFVEIIQERLPDEYSGQIANIRHTWFKHVETNDSVVNTINDLKQNGYNLYVLSNMCVEMWEYIKDFDVFKQFDGIVISAYEKTRKPYPEIFEILLNRYNLNPEECLLVDDDDTGKTTFQANAFKIKARTVKANDGEDVIKLLNENGINISKSFDKEIEDLEER